jgi:hypothetical protein
LVRFVVHPDDVHMCKLVVRDRGREIRSLGWWAAQECPKDLRDMEMNAFRFFGEAKKACPALKRYYLEAEDGFVKVARVAILPVFCVPTDKGKWPRLAPVLNRMIESIHADDWVSRFKQQKSVDPKIYEEWGDIVDPPQTQQVRLNSSNPSAAFASSVVTPSTTKNQGNSMALALLSNVPRVEMIDPLRTATRATPGHPTATAALGDPTATTPRAEPGDDKDDQMEEDEDTSQNDIQSAENGS